jgi:hypothetical protein
MNSVLPECIYYIKNEITDNQLFKLEIYENYSKISLVKKYFCVKKESYSKIYDYKININNYYQLKLILTDYWFYVSFEKPKYYLKIYKKVEKIIFVGFVIGAIIILI